MTLMEAVPVEQARVRAALRLYWELGDAGKFAATMLEAALAKMDRAMAGGDVVEILRAYEELKGCE